jgi:hypothetical protein
MQWYAETHARRTRQVIGDLLILGWVILWLLVARWTFSLVRGLAAPADPLRRAGTAVRDRMDEVAGQVGDLPLVGDQLTGPFRGAADAGASLVSAGDSLDSSVTRVAWLLSTVVAATPILIVAGAYLVLRITYVRKASALARLREAPSTMQLLALRALVSQPPAQLARVHADPLEQWRAGDPATVSALAGLELRRLGLRPAALRRQ